MKKLISLSLLTICLLTATSSCKKDNVSPGNNGNNNNGNNNNGNNGNNNNGNNEDTKIVINDLLNYYFVYVNSDGNLRVIYFFMDNGNLSGYRDGLNNRKGVESPAISNDVFTCNISAQTYSFTLKKDASGNISMISYTSSEGVYSNLEMFKTTDAPVFASTNGTDNIFHYSNNGDGIYLYFDYENGNVWRHDSPAGGLSGSIPYYLLSNNIGWKSGDENTMGVAVPKWKGNSSIKMVTQSSIPDLGQGVQTAFEL